MLSFCAWINRYLVKNNDEICHGGVAIWKMHIIEFVRALVLHKHDCIMLCNLKLTRGGRVG
jgi:hypothetical protein